MLRNIYRVIFRKPGKKDFFIEKTDAGEIRITHQALEDLIKRSTMDIKGLRRLSSEIYQTGQGLNISISGRFDDPDTFMQIADRLRDKIRQDVERHTGIMVREVKVLEKPKSGRRPARQDD